MLLCCCVSPYFTPEHLFQDGANMVCKTLSGFPRKSSVKGCNPQKLVNITGVRKSRKYIRRSLVECEKILCWRDFCRFGVRQSFVAFDCRRYFAGEKKARRRKESPHSKALRAFHYKCSPVTAHFCNESLPAFRDCTHPELKDKFRSCPRIPNIRIA